MDASGSVVSYPYHVRFRNKAGSDGSLVVESNGTDSDNSPRFSIIAAGGRHTLAATCNIYFSSDNICLTLFVDSKPLISIAPSLFISNLERLYTTITTPSTSSFFDVVVS